MNKVIKSLVAVFCCFIAFFGGCVYLTMPRPPKEAELIQNFNNHRADFEKLRDMLQADQRLRRIADWGVETSDPVFLGYPSQKDFSTNRFSQYLYLLGQTKAKAAWRDEGTNADVGIMVWGWGWAGDTRHISICWMDQAPTNQIATLDGYRGQNTYTNRVVAFRRIDQNWYLSADW